MWSLWTTIHLGFVQAKEEQESVCHPGIYSSFSKDGKERCSVDGEPALIRKKLYLPDERQAMTIGFGPTLSHVSIY